MRLMFKGGDKSTPPTEEVQPIMHVPRHNFSENSDSSRSRQGLQRNTLTLVFSGAGFFLAASSVFISFYMFKHGLQDLQHAQTAVDREMVEKVAAEKITAAIEATYAPRLKELEAT